MSVTVRTAPNPFEAHHVETELATWTGGDLHDYATLEGESIVCVWNGKPVPRDKWGTVRPVDGDDLFFIDRPEGIGLGVGGIILTAVGSIAGYGGGLTAFGAAVALSINVGVAVGLSYAARALVGQPESPDSLLPQTPSVYSFDGVKTTSSLGKPLPVVYGSHAVGGTLLSAFVQSTIVEPGVEPEGSGYIVSKLHMTVALCEGEISSVDTVLLNGQPTTAFSGLNVSNRLGKPDQTPVNLSGANETSTTQNVGLELQNPTTTPSAPDTEVVAVTTVGLVNSFHVNVTCPNGLYYGPVPEGVFPLSVEVEVRYRKNVGPGAWSDWLQYKWQRFTASSVTSSLRVSDLDRAVYDIEVRRKTPEHPDYIGEWGTFRSNGAYHDQTTFTSVTEIIQDDYAYPNTALIAATIPADQNFNRSAIPKLSVTLTGRKIDAWNPDTASWEDAATHPNGTDILHNPAWIVIDLLTNKRFGLGYRYDRNTHFDLDNWAELAAYCDEYVSDGGSGQERRHRFDGVFEGNESAWSSVIRILGIARATALVEGEKIRVKWERPRAATYHFNTASIIAGSWTEHRVSTRMRPTRMEVRFLDADRDYTISVAQADDPEAIAQGLPLRSAQEDAFGITRASAAARHARYLMNLAKLSTVYSFAVSVDALVVEVGDVVRISHEEPSYGVADGRLRGGSHSSFVVDNEFTLLSGTTYEVSIKHQHDDTLEVRRISSPPGTYLPGDTLTVDQDFTQAPAEFALYSIGEINRSTVRMLVSKIERREDLTAQITGIEYRDEIHEDDELVDSITVSTIPDPAAVPPCLAEPATVLEHVIDGQSYLQIFWQYTTGDLAGARVWVRQQSTPWLMVAQVDSPAAYYMHGPVTTGATYDVVVVQTAVTGASKNPGDCTAATITPDGLGDVPGPVTNVAAVQTGTALAISWDPVSSPYVPASYEVRRGEAWNLSRLVGSTSGTELETTQFCAAGSNPIAERFFVSARSGTGLYGPPGSVDIDPVSWFGGASVTWDGFGLAWPITGSGSLTNMAANANGFLEVSNAALDGVYVSPEITINGSATSNYRIGAIAWAYMTGGDDPGGESWSLSSVTGKTWNMHGPMDPSDWIASVTWEIRVASSSAGLASASWQPLKVFDHYGISHAQLRVTVSTTDTEWVPRVDYLHMHAEELP